MSLGEIQEREGTDFPPVSESAQTLAGIGKIPPPWKNFPTASKFPGKPFQHRISDSQSLLEFSDLRTSFPNDLTSGLLTGTPI